MSANAPTENSPTSSTKATNSTEWKTDKLTLPGRDFHPTPFRFDPCVTPRTALSPEACTVRRVGTASTHAPLKVCVVIGLLYYIYYYSMYVYNNHSNYHAHTFGIDLYDVDACMKMDPAKFRKNINDPSHPSYTQCISNMCTDGKFIGSRTTLAYDVEHIVDENGPEYKECDKNIVGNYVMAKNEWNQILADATCPRNIQKCCASNPTSGHSFSTA